MRTASYNVGVVSKLAKMRTASYNVDVASIVVHLQSKCTARSIAEEQNQAYAKFDRKYII